MATFQQNFKKLHKQKTKEKAVLGQQAQQIQQAQAQGQPSTVHPPVQKEIQPVFPPALSSRNLAQERAKDALHAVSSIKDRPADYGNYVGYVKAFPANIRNLGLGQSLAFLLSKAAGEKKPPANHVLATPHGLLYAHVTSWLAKRSIFLGDISPANFMTRLVEGNQSEYLHAQIEAMAYLEWLKKFAVAELDQPKESD